MNRVSGIDRVRALAAVSVMLAHILGPDLPGLWRYSFTGLPAVFVFFVISGLCIHFPYVSAPVPIRAFYTARFLRIVPPVIAAIVLARLVDFQFFVLWTIFCELWYYFLYPILRREVAPQI
jgi:peptidoglycan/LPS O-acetylase OafA/YrhL